MMNMDTRRKINFYLNPERNEADRYVCEVIDSLPQGERGQVWRAAMLAGFALRKQDSRLPNLLAELLTAETSFADIIQLMRAVFPEEMARTGWSVPAGPVATAPQTPQVPSVEDETRDNARQMFGQAVPGGNRKA
ncbi:plasmid partitioning/stability family protein [Mangrovibacter phragmitis]|uniref:plasmid partitioning/stability family protein n=1 Tax=Mangrovibacter phragmitis TaxID=1691903 RepID=UPI003519C95E